MACLSIKRNVIAVIVLCSLVWGASAAWAGFVYPGFSSPEDWQLNGDASFVGSLLRLTPASYHQRGSAWYKNRQHVVAGFRARFAFFLNDQGSIPEDSKIGGDGFAFVIQNSSATAIGDYGSGIGYGGVATRDAIPNSIAVEFDTWRNSDLNDPNENHLSVHSRGILANSPHEDYSLGSTTAIPDLGLEIVHTVEVRYLPGVMDIFVDDMAMPVLVVPVDLDATLAMSSGQAWIGFTASTWNGWANHDILSISFLTIPEPSCLVLAWVSTLLFVMRSCPPERR